MTRIGTTLDRWKAAAFLLGGGVWALDTAVNVLELLLEMTVPSVVFLVLILGSLLLTAVGAVGLYPRLAPDRLASTGTAVAGLAGLTITAMLVWGVGAATLGQSLPPGGLLAVVVVLMVLGMGALGIASLRAAVHPRAVGGLLLGLAAVWVVWLAGVAGAFGEIPEWGSAAFGVVLAVLTLSIGFLLSPGDGRPGRTPAANVG